MGALAAATLLQAEPTYPDARFLDGWRRLVLSDRKFLVMHGQVTLTLFDAEWRPGAAPPEADPVAAVVLGAESRMSLFGVARPATITRSFLDPGSRRSLEYREVKVGKSTKRMEFLDDAYRLIRTRPPAGRKRAPIGDWETFADELKPYRLPDGAPLPDGVRPHDSWALLYLVMAAQRDGGDDEFVVISKGKLLPVQVRIGDLRDNVRRVRDLATGRSRRLRLRERRLHLVPRVEDPAHAEFLSMQGEIEIWVEADTHTILEVSGSIPGAGRASLKLRAVEPAEN